MAGPTMTTNYATYGTDKACMGGASHRQLYGGRYFDATLTAEGNAWTANLLFLGDGVDILYGDNAAGTETGDDFIWAGGGGDYLVGGNGTDTLAGGTGVDYYYGGSGTYWFYLHTDIAAGESDYLLDFQAGVDDVLLPFIASGNVSFGVSGGYAYGYIPLAGGTNGTSLAAGRDCGAAAGGDAVHLTVLSSSKRKGRRSLPGPFDIISRLKDQLWPAALATSAADLCATIRGATRGLPPPCRARTSAGPTASASKLPAGSTFDNPPLTF